MTKSLMNAVLDASKKAESFGLPGQAGLDIHDGIVSDDLGKWTNEQFMAWREELLSKYGAKNDLKLLILYQGINEIIGKISNYLDSEGFIDL